MRIVNLDSSTPPSHRNFLINDFLSSTQGLRHMLIIEYFAGLVTIMFVASIFLTALTEEEGKKGHRFVLALHLVASYVKVAATVLLFVGLLMLALGIRQGVPS